MNRTGPPQALVVGPKFPYPPTSGGVKRTLRLLEAIERSGAEVHYFTPASADPAAVRVLAERGWNLHCVEDDVAEIPNRLHQHLRRRPGPWSRNLAKAIEQLCSPRVAFLQAEHVQYDGYLRKFRRLPRVLSTHNIDSHIEQGYADSLPPGSIERARYSYRAYNFKRAERMTGVTADAVFCVSNHDSAYYEQYSRNVIVAPNGVDDDFFTAGRDKHPSNDDVVFFGLMRYDPNVEGLQRFLRDGWPHVVERRPNARLLIAGDGGRERLGPRSPSERVSVLGVVDDIASLVAQARVIVVPIWRGGGTRLKVLEALATGRPIVGTSLGVSGIAGFEPGTHGIVADDPRGIGLAIVDLCCNPEKADRVGQAGPPLAEQYRWRHALRPAEVLYQNYVELAASRMLRTNGGEKAIA